MAHHDDDSNLSKEELEFNDIIRRGDDFMKIQIYRNAREWYTYALDSNFNNEMAAPKLNECNALIRSESRTIIKVVAVMTVAACILFFL